ncbi:MAG: RHS repeat-associated core domain-containing protein [Gemmataceae bacterium]
MFNRRIGVWTDTDGAGSGSGVQKWSAYDGENTWADFNHAGDMVTRYFNGREMDQRFARYDVVGESTAFYLTDIINSVRQVVDAMGTVQYSADYTAFGQIASQSGTGGDRFTYTGRELDASGQYFYRSRYYGDGRFLSEDSVGFLAGDPNLYRYTRNYSVNTTDPTGNFSWRGCLGGIVTGGIVGGIVGNIPGAIAGASLGCLGGGVAASGCVPTWKQYVIGAEVGVVAGFVGGWTGPIVWRWIKPPPPTPKPRLPWRINIDRPLGRPRGMG